jgi:hypothetical protein
MPDGVNNKVAKAKAVLDGANSFDASVRKQAPDPVKPKAKPASTMKKAAGGLMDALRSKTPMANVAGSSSDTVQAVKSTAEGINSNIANKEVAEQAMPKLHKGGTVKKDGPAVLKKGETVISKKTSAKHKGVVDALTEESKSEEKGAKEKKGEKKPEGHKKPKFHRTTIIHHSHGGHTVTHEAPMGQDGKPGENVEYSAQDMQGVHDGMDQHIGNDSGQGAPGGEPGPGGPEPAQPMP